MPYFRAMLTLLPEDNALHLKPVRLADGGISKDSSTGQSMRMCHKEANMRGNSIFYIIGVIVVVVFVLKFLGLW